jgi:hypothetical protein
MNTTNLFLVAYQPPEQGGLRELVCWTDNPPHARTLPDLCADQDLMHEVRHAVDADAQAHFGQAGGDVLRITTLALEGVKIEAIPDTPASAPTWKRARPAPDLSQPLRVFHVIPRAPEQVYWGFRLPEGQEQEGVLCLAPSPHAALVSAWSLAAFDPSHPSPSPCRDLAVWLGGWQRAAGLWAARSDHFPTAVLTPQRVSAEEIQRRAAPNAARGILALAFAPS